MLPFLCLSALLLFAPVIRPVIAAADSENAFSADTTENRSSFGVRGPYRLYLSADLTQSTAGKKKTCSNVLFPFVRGYQVDACGQRTGLMEWSFDSSLTSLLLVNDATNRLLVPVRDFQSDPDGISCPWSLNNSDSQTALPKYGFYPMKDSSRTGTSADVLTSTIVIPFWLTDNGHMEMTDGSYIPQTLTVSSSGDVSITLDEKPLINTDASSESIHVCVNFSEDFPFSYCYDDVTPSGDLIQTEENVPAASIFISEEGCLPYQPSSLYAGVHTLVLTNRQTNPDRSDLAIAWSFDAVSVKKPDASNEDPA